MGVIMGMTFLFNYLFEPFVVNVAEQKLSYPIICLLHALVSTLLFSLFGLIGRIPRIEERWHMKEEVLAVFFYLLLVGIGQFLIRDLIYHNPHNWSWRYLGEEIRNTLLVGSLFLLIIIPLNFRRLYEHYQASAQQILLPSHSSSSTSIAIKTEVKADDFVLSVDTFLFAKAEKNYVELLLSHSKGKPEKLLKRITLKALEEQLQETTGLLRVHRSYLVNLKKIERVTGNAQGYRLKLEGLAEEVPVARSYIAIFEGHMQKDHGQTLSSVPKA